MQEINKNAPVLVTGATGYIAGWIIKKLLEKNIPVHATIRNKDQKEKIAHLDKMASNSSSDITYFEADLLKANSFDKAMEGCELVIHTASPFFLSPKDPQKDLLDPAVNGTKNILNSVNNTPSVKRVVLTSSVAAIYGDAKDAQELPEQTLNESHWNTTSSANHQPYSYSKTLAEKAAWDMHKQQDRWSLAVINPSFVMGPATNPHANFQSKLFLQQLGNGTMKSGVPKSQIGIVDVREVSEAHIQAGFDTKAQGRHILTSKTSSFLEMAQILRKGFGDQFPIPKRTVPKWLLWLVGPTVGYSRKMTTNNIGYSFKLDNRKSIEALGVQYRPIEESLTEFFQQLVDEKLIKK